VFSARYALISLPNTDTFHLYRF